MKLEYSPYRLYQTQLANSRDTQTFHDGALIRVSEGKDWGVADLCPWPNLGDSTWQKEILNKGLLFQRAYDLACEDLKARKNKHCLQQPITFLNNYLLNGKKLSLEVLRQYQGCTVKIKADTEIEELAQLFNQVDFEINLRVDFNACLLDEQFQKFINLLSPSACQKIQYIEDPTVYNQLQWTIWNKKLPLALDFQKPEVFNYSSVSFCESFSYLVIKPTRQDLSFVKKINLDEKIKFKIILTSAMDHPVGLAHGLLQAQKWLNEQALLFSGGVFGFLTLDLYQTTPFHHYFEQNRDIIKFTLPEKNEFGVGLTEELSQCNWLGIETLFDFSQTAHNQLLINPRLSEAEKKNLFFLQKGFENKFTKENHFLVPSSGSSQKSDESVKLIVLHREAILNSARRFNDFFQAQSNESWGLVLPTHHVAGLGVMARAHLAEASVFQMTWQADLMFDWLSKNKICFLSLVPSQVFDLVTQQISAPKCIRKVLVGAGSLQPELKQQAMALGWPIVETYGMTETASMIAVKEATLNQKDFYLLPGVEVRVGSNQLLQIKCNSLLNQAIQLNNNQVTFLESTAEGWFQTQDRVELMTGPKSTQLRFLGRENDYIKILGEGVSLLELRSLIERLALDLKIYLNEFVLLPWPDVRSENKIILVYEDLKLENNISNLQNEFNKQVRPYEKIKNIYKLNKLPRTELGKIKLEQLKAELAHLLKDENYDKKI